MSRSADRLWELLPAYQRLRDAQRGYPLRALLRVINEQVNVVEDDIEQLYENWFIETCAEWAVPYIGDLIGVQPAGEPGAASSGTAPGVDRALVPRREVAQTLGFRRRKGTVALLEDLAAAVAGWPAQAVEFYRLLGWTQHVDHLQLQRGRTVDLRDGAALDLLGGPFDRQAHTSGRRTIPDVGVFAWRLRSYPLTHTPACCLDDIGPHCFTFNPLCTDTQLFTKPRTAGADGRPREIDLPVPIRRRAFEKRLGNHPLTARASKAYYGVDRSLVIWAPGWPDKTAPQPIPAERIVPADLGDWRYRAPRGQVGVDPVLGRMVFPSGQFPRRGVWVSYRYGFSADMGGGEYHRPLTSPADAAHYDVTKDHPAEGTFDTINGALTRWRQDQQALGEPPDDGEARERWDEEHRRLGAAVVEILDSSVYRESLEVKLEAGESLQIRAADRRRPVVDLVDWGYNRTQAFAVWGKAGSRLSLDGLVIAGGPLQINGPDPTEPEQVAEGDLCDVRLRHVTLVPGWALEPDCEPTRPAEASLVLIYSSAKVFVDHSIIGSIDVVGHQVRTDPVEITLRDSILDATGPALSAVGATDLPLAFARLTVLDSTVIGCVDADSFALAENSVFLGRVSVARRQVGCMRFCYVGQAVRTPRRYRCQPDLAAEADGTERGVAARAARRVRPVFTSLRYGSPGYCQLAASCAPEITGGADDESEMGAFHDLFQPQRTANLRRRLDEYTPAGMEVRIGFVN